MFLRRDTMTVLKVENLTKTYGKGATAINAVDNVSFSVDKGEFVAIVGPSGCGKSTLLHLIGGVDRPTSGDDMLEVLALKNRRQHLPNQLSGGQQQRVSIGRALINNPAIILADEPTGNLDSKASREIMDLLRLSNKKYKQTVIVITHDLNIALKADRVITMADGKLIKDERN